MNEKLFTVLFIFLLANQLSAQNNWNWNLVWSLEDKPFLQYKAESEIAIVKAGFDPDKDGNLSLMIAGEINGQIYDLEYKGSGDPADSSNWELNVIFDIWELSGFAPTDTPTLSPRLFYGHPANDMDNDGKDEYVFVNYSADFSVWEGDRYLWIVEIDKVTGVKTVNSIIPNRFQLMQNYPNPFNPSTNIEFSLPENGFVSLKIYDILGREIQTLINDQITAGNHKINFDAGELSSGIYYYTMSFYNADNSQSFSNTKKLVLQK